MRVYIKSVMFGILVAAHRGWKWKWCRLSIYATYIVSVGAVTVLCADAAAENGRFQLADRGVCRFSNVCIRRAQQYLTLCV